ncbi:MAG: TolC family protein [Proteobacteria bacterium]|nr:TolC family protein [Pseudomonadota bacterium]
MTRTRARTASAILFAVLLAFGARAGAQDGDATVPAPPQAPAPLIIDMPPTTPGPEMTLDEALRLADKRNLTIEAARLEVEKAEAQLKQAYALVLPGLQAKLTLMHRDHEDSFNFADSLPPDLLAMMGATDMQDTVISPQQSLSGVLEAGMALINAQSWFTIGAAKKGVEAARLAIEDGRQLLLLGVSQAFYVAMMTRSLIGLYEEQIRSSQHHLDVARARYEAGTGLRIDVIRAETELESARQDLLMAHYSFDNARDTIAQLTGCEDLPLPVEAGLAPAPEGDDAKLVERASAARTDLAAKRAIIGAMEKQLDASWMQFLPTLDVGWQLQYQFTKPGDMGSDDRSRWALVFTLSLPIYNHFRYGDLDYKRATLKQAMIEEEDKARQLGTELRTARREYLSALSANAIAERQVALAREALTLIEASYEAGTGTSLVVTDARRTLSATNVNLITTRLKAQIALLALLRAAGRDMKSITAPPASE